MAKLPYEKMFHPRSLSADLLPGEIIVAATIDVSELISLSGDLGKSRLLFVGSASHDDEARSAFVWVVARKSNVLPNLIAIIGMVGGIAGLLTQVVYQTSILSIIQEGSFAIWGSESRCYAAEK